MAVGVSLLLILRQFGSGEGSGSFEPGTSDKSNEVAGALYAGTVFYPSVPGTMPDLNDGYLFNKDRYLDQSDLDNASLSGLGSDTIDMEQLVYSGSIIIGDLRKALVAYQEQAPLPQRRAIRNVRGRSQKKPAKGTYKHKQLSAGEVFMGYRVTVIENDRIVFEKGDERIEKFLFDAGKERVEIKSSPPPSPPAAAVSPSARPVPQASPQRPGTPPKTTKRPTMTRPGTSSEPTSPPPTGRTRRSQRLLGINPSFVPPTPPEEAK